MIRVYSEADKVIIDLGGRKNDVLMACDEALKIAEALDYHAGDAEVADEGLFTAQNWSCKVESYGGHVALRFGAPMIGAPSRVPLTAKAARTLAETIRDKESWARHKMRLVIGSN